MSRIFAVVALFIATLNGVAIMFNHFGPAIGFTAAAVQFPLWAVFTHRMLTGRR